LEISPTSLLRSYVVTNFPFGFAWRAKLPTGSLARQDEAAPSALRTGLRSLVEAGGFEPPSASPLPLDLHV